MIQQRLKPSSVLHLLLASNLWLVAAHAAYADPDKAVCEAFEDNRVVVLIIHDNGDHESESYADWAEYLNDFASSHTEDYRLIKLTQESLTRLIDEADRYIAPYSMVFLKEGRPSLFYEGPIVEPQTYQYVELFYAGREIPAHLSQFAPLEVEVRLKTCR